MTVLEKLLSVQGQLKAPKDLNNSFSGYKYRSCEGILEAVKPLCQEVKAVIILTDEVVMVGERYYVKVTAKFIDVETGEIIENNAFAREEEVKKGMDGSQITGASSSYARKYALNGLLDIDDTKDSDNTNNKLCSDAQIEKMKELNVIEANVLARYKIKSLKELTENQAEFIIKTKEKALEKAGE